MRKEKVYPPQFNLQVKKNSQEYFVIRNKLFSEAYYVKNFNENIRIAMPDIEKITKGHDHRGLRGDSANKVKTCNCRKNENCPLNGKCLTDSVVY